LEIATTTLNNFLSKTIRKFFFLVMLLCPLISVVQAQAQEQTQDQEETWTVNFRDADIEELIRFVAEATNKTIIVDSTVQGTVQVISTTPVNSEALYQLFLSILEVQGYAAVESNNVVRIIPSQNARTVRRQTLLDKVSSDLRDTLAHLG
jgi:general secretion pathway protein D